MYLVATDVFNAGQKLLFVYHAKKDKKVHVFVYVYVDYVTDL